MWMRDKRHIQDAAEREFVGVLVVKPQCGRAGVAQKLKAIVQTDLCGSLNMETLLENAVVME
jgi:hypothetical protein